MSEPIRHKVRKRERQSGEGIEPAPNTIKEDEKATSEPKVTMSAVKLDRDGNVVEEIPFDNVEVEATPGFLENLKREMQEGWAEGRTEDKQKRETPNG